ncbi:MAG: 30S ribosomal protein S6 [Treponema sp.]|nr:30S ribosomal protein S6 [Treponema sp.]
MRKYELMTIFPVEEDQCQTGLANVRAILGEFGAEIEKEEFFGERDLTYEVKKRNRGKFYLFNIKLNPAKVVDIDRKFKLDTILMKYMFVRIDE